ncbi:unnamed protein product [Sphenostylis stenocarpa]|uniref:Uncharacterized protein n=1 Tax=Sphenostylis stenocarpa TaxID=92480 RepID=A0AA86S7S4_9FABA|nr:unnamed protein product [Sphenostylis stenocarpa]
MKRSTIICISGMGRNLQYLCNVWVSIDQILLRKNSFIAFFILEVPPLQIADCAKAQRETQQHRHFVIVGSSATFQLIARDSTDPSFSQSDRVFVRVDNNPVSFPLAEDSGFEDKYDDYNCGVSGGPLPEEVKKEILELGFPNDGYNYLSHLREIKNTGVSAAFFHNPKFKLQHLPRDVKAYDASRLQISEVHGEPEENSLYTVASKTTSVRVQKAVDPEVAALLDDSDVSRLGSDVEDLEEDFVVQANLLKDEDDEEKNKECNLNIR